MKDQDIKNLLDLAKILKRKIGKESEKATLISAGIIDENFEYTTEYQALKDLAKLNKSSVLQSK